MPFTPLVLLERNRVCHVCRLGSRLDERVIGALVVYIGLEQDLTVYFSGSGYRVARVIAVEPYRAHRVVAGRQFVATILVEPESVTQDCIRQLLADVNGMLFSSVRFSDLRRLLIGALHEPNRLGDSILQRSFDELIFNQPLEARNLDRRIEKVAIMLERKLNGPVDSGQCARELALSTTHFRRLFQENTGVQFRLYRMWKRARAYLHYVTTNAPLTQIAFDLGYPDSTHFSHSIRNTYGLPPRSMKSSMQNSVFLTARESGQPNHPQ